MKSVQFVVLLFALGYVPGFLGHTILEDIAQDIISIIYGKMVETIGECAAVDSNKIDFLLHNRQLTTPILLNATTYDSVDPTLPTKILLHGWIGSAQDKYLIEMRQAYLKRANYNIITVDWSTYAVLNYASAHCNVPKVGKIVGNFIHNLVQAGRIHLNTTHLVAHSMGAHVAGYAGQFIKNRIGEKVTRITGLDPAGPIYLGLPERQRLSKDDAKFVDVIHTNAGVFGYPARLGHVDFYPNCGIQQNGCRKYNLTDNVTMIQEISKDIFCNHNRSNQFFIESISSKNFLGRHCMFCNIMCSIQKVVMGEDCPRTVQGVYYLNTNRNRPYAKG